MNVFSFNSIDGTLTQFRYTEIDPIKIRDSRILSNRNGKIRGLIVASRPSMAVLLAHGLIRSLTNKN